MPLSIFYKDGSRGDGIAALTDDAIQFTPFTPDYSSAMPAIRLTATYWGPAGQPEKVEVLFPHLTILNTCKQHFALSPQHLTHLETEATMTLANEALTAFIMSATATFTDPNQPPTWEALRALWKSEGHEQILGLQDRLAADEQRIAAFQAAMGPIVSDLQQRAATTQQLDAVRNDMASLCQTLTAANQQLAEQIRVLQGTVDALVAARLDVSPPTPSSGGHQAPIGALVQALTAANADPPPADFTADIREWGPLRERYGSWDAVRDRLYRILHIVPNAEKPPTFEALFSSFDEMYTSIFKRWDSLKDLTTPANVDLLDNLNNALRRLILASKLQQGLTLKSDVARMNAAASASAFSLQRSMESTFRSVFVPARQNGMPRLSHGSGGGGRPVNRAAEHLRVSAQRASPEDPPPARRCQRGHRRSRRRHIHEQHVEQQHMDANVQPVGTSEPLLRRVRPSQKPEELPSFSSLTERLGVDQAHVHLVSDQHLPQDGLAPQSAVPVRLRTSFDGSLFPTSQAVPLTSDDLTNITAGLPPSTAIPLKLAWKTASRWNEIARLTPDSVLHCTPEEVVLYFGTETKASRQHPFRPDLFVVIQGKWTDEIASYLQARTRIAGKGVPLFPISTETITDTLRPYGFSAHSLKRGAIEHLFQVLEVGDSRMHLIPLLAKHSATYGPLRELTMRYVTDQTSMARHLGTGPLTSLL